MAALARIVTARRDQVEGSMSGGLVVALALAVCAALLVVPAAGAKPRGYGSQNALFAAIGKRLPGSAACTTTAGG